MYFPPLVFSLILVATPRAQMLVTERERSDGCQAGVHLLELTAVASLPFCS